MKQIICLIDTLGPGGAQRQIVGLACLLKQVGDEVVLATYHKGDFYENLLQEYGVRHVVVTETENKLKRVLYITNYFKKVKPDAVIAYQASPSIISCLAKLLGGKYRLIVSERNTNQQFTNGDRLRFFLYRWANYVIPNSYSQSAFVLGHSTGLKEKVKVIVNFVDTDRFVPGNYIKKEGPLGILIIGRMTPQKNLFTFIVKLLKEKGETIVVDWYGYADQGGFYFKDCLQKVEEYNLADCISFHQPTDNVVDLYQAADVFCLPSIYEGTPNVICEAMSCGLPILCSDVCDNSRIVQDGVNGLLFNPLDPADIADTIKKFIILDSSKKKAMGLASRKRALDLFSKELFVRQYVELLESKAL